MAEADFWLANEKEKFWHGVELAVPFLMLLTTPFFEDAEAHEFVLGGIEGVAIWRQRHWAEQKKIATEGGRRTRPDYGSLLPHIGEGVNRRKGTSPARR